MRRNKESVISVTALSVLLVIFLLFFYGKIIFHPNSYLFNATGDGMKNYYTYAYLIHNNPGYTNFEGMNFPYGENVMYTDCHPLLAFLLKFLAHYIPGISTCTIDILNLMLIVSLAVTAFIIYFIFSELRLNKLLAVLSAFGITVLSPQIFRITGHYALSYSFFIPLTIYLLMLYEKGENPKKTISFLILSILLFFFIHAYLGMIAITLVITFVFVSLVSGKPALEKPRLKKSIVLLTAAVLPALIFYAFIAITDIHTGRTTNPWGILESHADLNTVFLPVDNPLNKIKDYLFPHIQQTWEGWAYIGISAIIGLLFYLTVSVKSSISSRRISLNKYWLDQLFLRELFAASLIILAFSMFIPFRFHMESMVNYVGFIKQFRAIGRFAWVFYFVSTILAVCLVNKAFQILLEKKRIPSAYFLLLFVPISFIFEGIFYHIDASKEITRYPNLFDKEQTPQAFREDINSIHPGKYQAILPFPFYYIGSENFGVAANSDIYRLADLFSYHLDLPVLGSYLTRASICESRKIMQLFASNFYRKEIQDDLPNDKPFLVICQNAPLNNAENKYLESATCLIKRDEYSVYELPVDVFFTNNASNQIDHFNKIRNNLFEKNGFLVSDTTLFFSLTDFGKRGPDIKPPSRDECYSGLQRNYNRLLLIKHGQLPLNRRYTARFWMFNAGENCGQDCLDGMIFFEKRKGESVKWLDPIVNARESHEINNGWSLVEISFDNNDPDADYDLTIKGSDISRKTIYIDDLLLYDSELNIFKMTEQGGNLTLFSNDHWIQARKEK